ncbi:PD-(D/E)XK nuclease-like domain-containing protein [Pantoea stewartii]|uniref:RecE family exodeoxyribonuclease n=1 Tax=Pantoea stewartii TaxID=66269 RepID=UPI0023F97AA5|nr:RecE family exodeoxyribonuclease [Pantoea stewartii]MDF7787797.1 PD-(D/E)XK nuclease-like domain-containing protein [Pantoea stewartii]
MSELKPFFVYLRAKKKAGQKDHVFWETRASENRVIRDAANAMEDAGLSEEDFFSPAVTNFHVVDDLPPEGVLDSVWCERYQLASDKMNWEKIPGAEGATTVEAAAPVTVDPVVETETTQAGIISLEDLTVEQAVIGAWIFGNKPEYTKEDLAAVAALAMDTDESYPQNLLLVSRSTKVMQLQHAYKSTIADWVQAAKLVWVPGTGVPQVADLLKFTGEWLDAHNDSSAHAEGNNNRRSDVTAKWAARITGKSQTVATTTVTEKTASGATAGGGIKTDRNPDYEHTLQTLGIEIACALFPSDFDIYEIPTPIFRRAKEMVAERHETWAAWNRALSNTPGILDNSRAAVFALIRSAPENIHLTPGELQYYINSNLAETDHANPSQETLTAAHSTVKASTPEPVSVPVTTAVPVADEPIKNMGDGIFDITALMAETVAPQVEAHAPVAEPVTVAPAETASNEGKKTEVMPEVAEVATTFPAVFEPGRYENIPNEAYHAASGISSSMVKDARISLMYFHGRHVTGVIQREVTDALTFGTLVHTVALEPEKLEQEFAIFPGIPAGAFTNTDSLKAFIREFNADKPKAEQLKLTGKKEELQEAIRAVKPEAIFADEFEQQWLNDNRHKTILTSSQMSLATDIRTALLCHSSVANLLNHPSRVNEVSYFGMDDETGLEVRVRPDIELEIDGIRIAADLKTTSMGRIKQDYLRARLHREITERDYHLSAAMYSEVAGFDQFFWIFVNKDPGYHWVAVIEASQDLLELGSLEYHRTMSAIARAYDTGIWPAPITDDYTDELNDFDLRRLEILRPV